MQVERAPASWWLPKKHTKIAGALLQPLPKWPTRMSGSAYERAETDLDLFCRCRYAVGVMPMILQNCRVK